MKLSIYITFNTLYWIMDSPTVGRTGGRLIFLDALDTLTMATVYSAFCGNGHLANIETRRKRVIFQAPIVHNITSMLNYIWWALLSPRVSGQESAMQDSNHNLYDPYDAPSVPHIPYEPDAEYVSESPSLEATDTSSSSPVEPQSYSPSPALAMPDSPSALPARKKRPKLWVSIVVITPLFVVILLATLGYISYLNRSTPMKTLDILCTALQTENYTLAYNQFSTELQSRFSQADLAQVLASDKVIACTHGTVDDSGSSVTTSLHLLHNSRGVNDDVVILTKDEKDQWKINDLQRQ